MRNQPGETARRRQNFSNRKKRKCRRGLDQESGAERQYASSDTTINEPNGKKPETEIKEGQGKKKKILLGENSKKCEHQSPLAKNRKLGLKGGKIGALEKKGKKLTKNMQQGAKRKNTLGQNGKKGRKGGTLKQEKRDTSDNGKINGTHGSLPAYSDRRPGRKKKTKT